MDKVSQTVSTHDDSKKTKSVHSINVSQAEPVKSSKERTSDKSFSNHDKWCYSVCFMHKDRKRKAKDCPLGKCKTFLEASPEERRRKATEKGICHTASCTNVPSSEKVIHVCTKVNSQSL